MAQEQPLTLEQREAELSLAASLPIVFAGTVVDKTPAIVSNAVKSGYDAAQRIAAALASTNTARTPSDGTPSTPSAEIAGTVPDRRRAPANSQQSGDLAAHHFTLNGARK